MSTQSTKKKRMGSRRWVGNQNKTSEADEFHVTDSTAVVQHSTPGENTESLNISANPDYSKSETQNPPSPELSKHRKKLGSSRRNKGGPHGKDSATESYDKPREEVEEKTRGTESPRKTQMSLTIQPEQQEEELSQRTEHDMSARHDSSLYSAMTPDYFSEFQYSAGSNNPETYQESFISKSQNVQANQDEHDADYKVVSDSCTLVETMLEGTHKSDTVQREELTENAHLVGISEVTSLNLPSDPTVDQQMIDQSDSTEIAGDERYNVTSLTEKESKERHEGTYLSGQDGNLQGNDLEGDSHVKSVATEFSTTAEITTDQSSPRTNTELECSVEQAIFSSPNECLNLHHVNSTQHSEDAINKEREQFKPTEMYEINHSSSVTHVTEDAVVISGNVVDQAEISDTYQSELIVKSTDDSATRQLDSNPDDEHDMHPTKEDNFDTEDDLYDTEIPRINLMSESHLRSGNIEFSTESEITTDDSRTREHTEPECSIEHSGLLSSPKDGLPKGVHHFEDAVNKVHEQEVKPTQKHEMDHYSDYDEHDKRETDFKVEVSEKSIEAPLEEMDKSDTFQIESSLQTQKSETNAPLDSQPQQDNTDFNSSGSRRKLGSSRRNKGRHRVKESVAESYLRPTEEVVQSVSDNEALETTQMLVAIERTNQEELSPESCDVVVPVTDDNSLYSAIMSDYSSEVQNPNETNYPETDMESLIPKSENLQEDHDERETDFKVEVSDKSVEATLEEMDQSDTLQSQQDRGTYHSEDGVDKVHEQEVNPTHELDHSSESVTQVATEHAEIISGNLIDQAEISDTYQSEMTVKSTDDSAAKQEDLDTDDKQDVHPTKENSIEALEQTNEDEDTEKLQISDTERVDSALGHVYEGEASVVEDDIKPSVEQTVHQEKEGILSGDEESESSLQTQQSETNAPLDSQPQQDDTDFNSIGNRRKLGSSRRNKGRHRVKESVAESYLRLTEEVVQSVSDNEALETTQMLVAIEKTNQEELSQESEHDIVVPVTDDNSLSSAIMSDYSSEVQSSNTTNYPETDMESLIPKSENLQEDHDERETDFKVEVSDKSVEATLEEMDQSDTLQNQEDRGTYHSEDGVDKVHEQEVNPTHELDHSSESVTQVSTETAEIISGNLIDQAEIRDTYQFEFIVKGTDDSSIMQEDLNPVDTQDVHPTKENSIEALEQTNEDEDTEKLQISDTERVDSALGHVYEGEASVVEDDIKPSVEQTVHQEKEGILSGDEESESSLQTQQSETNAPLDSQPQQDDTDFNSIGNRRKLGSSRRNKGRHRVKESVAESYLRPTEEVVQSVSDNEALETTQMLVAIERTNQEELSQESEHDVVVPVTDDNSLYSAIMSDYSSEVQSPNTTNSPETDMESLIPKSENLQEDHDERETDFKVEVSDKSVEATLEEMDQSDTLQSQEDRGTYHSEDGVDKVHEQEVNPTHELDHSSESVTQVATEDAEILSGNLIDQAEISDTYQSEMSVKSTDDSAAEQEDLDTDDKQVVHPTKENSIEALEQTNEDENTEKLQISDTERVDSALGHMYEGEASVVEDDIKPSVEQTVHQEKEGLNSEVEESDSSLQTLHLGNADLDSQPEQNDTNFNPLGSRRKLGSSRRNRGRRHVKDPVAESNDSPTEEIVGNIRDNAQTEGISDQVKEDEHVGALVGISEFMSSSLHPSLTVDQQIIGLSNFTEMPEQDLSNVYSVKEKESKDGDEDTDLLRQDGNSQGNYLVSESHLKLSDIESSTTPEISTEKSSTEEHVDIECVKQAAFSSPKEELSTNEEQDHVNFSQVRGSLLSENVLNEVHEEVVKPTQMQEMHQIDFSSVNESLQSEMNAVLNTQDNSQDNSVRMEEETDFNRTGNRRKLGSSRRNKGRQQVKVSVAKTYHEPKDEFVENARGDEALETTKILLATDTTGQEEFNQQNNLDLKPVSNEENTEKMLEDTILSQNVMGNSTMGTTDITTSSGKDDSVESNKDVKEPENFSQFTGNNTVKIDLIQSPEDDSYANNISNHDDSVTTGPLTTDVLEQEEAYLVQSREALSCNKDSGQQIDGAIETMVYVIKDYNTEVASSVDVQVFEQNEVGEEEPTKKDHEAQEITHAELFSAAQTNIGTLAPFDIGLKENRAETAVDVPEESGISCNQQQGIQEKTDLDNSENLQGKSKQKRRKMGSTRRTQHNREPEEGMGNEDENKESDSNMVGMKFDKMEVVGLPMIVTADVHQNENTKPSLSPVDKEQQGTNVISTVQDLALEVLPPVDSTKENNFEALEQTNEEQQISGTEREDTALGQVYMIEVEDHIKPSAEQTVEGFFPEVEESSSSLQTLQSGTNATLDSQSEQNDTNFNPIGSRRKLGSSRRNKGRQHAKDSEQQGTNEISTVQDLASMALPPEQSTVDVEPSQLDDFTSTEMHVPSVLAGTNTTNTGITGESFVSSYETTQSAQNDEERPESVNVIQDQALKSAETPVVADLEMMKSIVRGGAADEHKVDQANIQELNDVNEGAHNTNLEMKNPSPNLNSPSRRRKMGSTRRNLGSRSKREELNQQQEVENEATETVTNAGDVKSVSFSIEEKEELQPLTEDKEIDSEQSKGKVFETVEYSHAFDSHVKPPPHQEIEENPVSHVQLVETDHQLTPSDPPAILSTSPTAGGRRRKLGSSRKLRGPQTERGDRETDTQNRDVTSITEESDIKTSEDDSLGLDKISEVDESDKKPPSNISVSKAEEHSRPVSEKTPQQATPVQAAYSEIRLGQESQKTFSLAGGPKGAALKSKSYNVMMVGDSCVGKSSFMRRAQSGKFSLDLPSSVGLDSCMWPVVVDGKPVVLHLWDTAGQERFHSITRQIFHKAQAFLLMYDITSTQSFSAVTYWANCIQEGAAEDVTILLLGNKSDAERKVKTQEGANLAREYNFEFMECSAATGENVIHSLETVARMLSQKDDIREETTVLQKEPQQKKSGCC